MYFVRCLLVFGAMVFGIQGQLSIEPAPTNGTCPGLSIPIPKGERGDVGPAGPTGANGDPGPKGAKGTTGTKGERGVNGDKGDQGTIGSAGNNGNQGPEGIKGEKGAIGKCDDQCGDIQQLNATLQALITNYQNEITSLKDKFNNLNSLTNPHQLGSKENSAVSCKDILKKNQYAQNGKYYIQVYGVPGGKMLVHCIMYRYDLTCPAGLTQVMKIDGSQPNFAFSSILWGNKASFKPENGQSGDDNLETKLPTYWSTPFTKICLRMRVKGSSVIKQQSIDVQADSLFDLIADDQYRATSLGLASWKNLINYPSPKLQTGCSKEGFNVQGNTTSHARVRIGIVGDSGDTCDTPNSFIGFGSKSATCNNDPTTSCGNEAGCNGQNGDSHIQAHGYIYVY